MDAFATQLTHSGSSMHHSKNIIIRQLRDSDVGLFRELLEVFGRVFDEISTYTSAQPDGRLQKPSRHGERMLIH